MFAPAPGFGSTGKKNVARDVRIVKAGIDRLKDEVAASLLRAEQGARALHIPRGAPAAVFAEFAAERRGDKGWENKPGQHRNEALDLSVYALALVIAVLGAEKVADWSNPPTWARAC
jgi:phage terminase large subunit GpA-like protein